MLLNIDEKHMSEAEDWIKKAIEADKRNGMMQHLGKGHLSYAELLKRKGNIPKARENLTTAAQIFEECGADGDLKKAQDQLNSLPANT